MYQVLVRCLHLRFGFPLLFCLLACQTVMLLSSFLPGVYSSLPLVLLLHYLFDWHRFWKPRWDWNRLTHPLAVVLSLVWHQPELLLVLTLIHHQCNFLLLAVEEEGEAQFLLAGEVLVAVGEVAVHQMRWGFQQNLTEGQGLWLRFFFPEIPGAVVAADPSPAFFEPPFHLEKVHFEPDVGLLDLHLAVNS